MYNVNLMTIVFLLHIKVKFIVTVAKRPDLGQSAAGLRRSWYE